MNSLAYFFPTRGGVDLLTAAGLEHVNRPGLAQTEIGATGPDGMSGMVFHHFRATPPAPLEWHKARGDWWLGWHTGHRPGPGDLFRGTYLPLFYAVRLLDGNEWQVPVVIPCRLVDANRPCGLPSVFQVIEGEYREGVRPEFERVHALAQRMELTMSGNAPSWGHAELIGYCAAMLGASYYVGPDELVLLGLIGQRECDHIVSASLDIPEILKVRGDNG